MNNAITLEQTNEMSRLNHRLLLGLQFCDAMAQQPLFTKIRVELESLGTRPCTETFATHPQARYAIRFDGRLKRLLPIAAAEKTASPPASVADDPTRMILRSDSRSRIYVPRRISCIPQQTDGVPPSNTNNIRNAWLWPGVMYPVPTNATTLRGQIRRGASMETSTPVAWARIIITQPTVAANFATETQVGWAHGDDRGEFLAILGANAVPGGNALPPSITLRVWVFLPPVAPSHPDDPISDLVLEHAGTDSLNDTLKGISIPTGYSPQPYRDITLKPGHNLVMTAASLLF